MSDVVIKDTEKFERIIEELEGTVPEIADSFKLQNRNFSMINGTDTYKGKCQSVISEKYDLFKNNYESINEALTNYIKYLKITLENYKEYERTLNKTIEENLDNLNVN